MTILENKLFACTQERHTPQACQNLNDLGNVFLALTLLLTLLGVVVLNLSHNRRRNGLNRKERLIEDEESKADTPIW